MRSVVAVIADIGEEKEPLKEADKVKRKKQRKVDEAVKNYSMNRRRSNKIHSEVEEHVVSSFCRMKQTQKTPSTEDPLCKKTENS